MFLGEFSCLAAFYLLRCRAARHPDTSADPQQPFNPLLFLPPALCDMTGTSIMYVGESPGQAAKGSNCSPRGMLVKEPPPPPAHLQFSSSVVSDSAWTAACQTSLSITSSWSLLKLMSTESVMPSNHLILCLTLINSSSAPPSHTHTHTHTHTTTYLQLPIYTHTHTTSIH